MKFISIKKAEHRRIDVFELWCWRRLLRVPWTARRSNQSILKEISPGCSLEGLMLKLKLLCFGHLMRRADSFANTLMLGKLRAGGEGDDRGWDGWMASPTRWTWVWVNSGSLWRTGRPGVLQFMGSQRVRHNWVTELNWLKKGWIGIETHYCLQGGQDELLCYECLRSISSFFSNPNKSIASCGCLRSIIQSRMTSAHLIIP